MAVIRLFILVAVLGGLTLLLAQNFSPALPLVFLGTQTQAFPLAMWILFSIVAGAATSLCVSSLFGFAGYFARERPKSSSARASSYRQQDNTSRRAQSTQSSEYNNTTSPAEDWDLDNQSEDWDFEEMQSKSKIPNQDKQDRRFNDQEYERKQAAKTTSKPDTSYSYSEREPKNTGVGRTESIYDADYRVIVPPYNPENPESTQPTSPTSSSSKSKQSNDDDDWSFFDEDSEKNEK
jgi:hypothetical protein